jgi:hypothetical protein
VTFPRRQRSRACHGAHANAWARPFHMPPRPRQCWTAEFTVKPA